MRRKIIQGGFLLLVAAAWLWPVRVVVAQEPVQVEKRDQRRGPRGRGPREGAQSRPWRDMGGWRLTQRLFRPSPEDRGPLREGEAEELLAFVEEHMPQFHSVMQHLRERDPRRFEEKLAEHAPRLRHLRRIFERSPQIGRIIKAHAENGFQLRRDMRALRRARDDSALHERALQAVRERLAKGLDLEIKALETLADELEENLAERVEARVTYLLSEAADLASQPEKLRELVDAVQAEEAGAPRDEALAKLRGAVTRQIRSEIKALRERCGEMRAGSPEEVDRRLAHLVEMLDRPREKRPDHRGGHRRPRRD